MLCRGPSRRLVDTGRGEAEKASMDEPAIDPGDAPTYPGHHPGHRRCRDRRSSPVTVRARLSASVGGDRGDPRQPSGPVMADACGKQCARPLHRAVHRPMKSDCQETAQGHATSGRVGKTDDGDRRTSAGRWRCGFTPGAPLATSLPQPENESFSRPAASTSARAAG